MFHFGKSKLFITFELAVMLGFVFTQYFSLQIHWYTILIPIIISVALILDKKKLWAIIVILFAIGLVLGTLYLNYFKSNYYPKTLPIGQTIEFEGYVSDYPDVRDNNIKYKVTIQKVSSICENCNNLSGQTILLTLDPYPKYSYNDKLKIRGYLEKPTNFQSFDYESYLSRYEVFAVMRDNPYKNDDFTIENIGQRYEQRWIEAIYRFKDVLNEKMALILPEPESGLLNALLLGNKRTVDPELYQIMTLIGISHIIVVSGYHVTIIIKIIADTTRRLSRWQFFILGTGILIGLIIITGMTPSVIRAAIMAWLFVLARLIGRKGSLISAFIFTCFLLVLQNPLILFFDLGFQLSVLSVLGMIFITPIFEEKVFKKKNLLSVTLAATFGAQIMVAPFLIYEFGRLSIVAPLANLFIVPIIPLTMGIGFFGLAGSFINITLGKFISYISWLLLKYIIIVSDIFSNLPIVSVNLTIDKWYYIVGIYGIIFFGIYYANKKLKTKNQK